MQPTHETGSTAARDPGSSDLLYYPWSGTATGRRPALTDVAERAVRRPPSFERPAFTTPTREARARALLVAFRAERRDAGQRLLIEEMLSHFRAACVAAGHGDPLPRPALAPRERGAPLPYTTAAR